MYEMQGPRFGCPVLPLPIARLPLNPTTSTASPDSDPLTLPPADLILDRSRIANPLWP
jgi:hypothetical protein